jgi:hypothetical protein
MDTFSISKDVVLKLQRDILNGVIHVQDGRGHHQNHFRNPANLIALIDAHINQFPRYECHYSRRRHEVYLSPDLNVSKMFRMFLNQHPLDEYFNKESLYRQRFQNSRLHIGTPLSDTCGVCDSLEIRIRTTANNQERDQAQAEKDHHLQLADLAYRSLYNDVNRSQVDSSYVVMCGDLQKVLFTPTLTHSEIFYRRQLSTYNFCMYMGGDDSARMALWNETEGARGVDEMGSCILLAVEEMFQPLPPGQLRHFVFWSDRCRGQVNNYHLLALFKFLIARGYFTSIEQKFLHTGHSYMPCDRLFAMIEKKKKTCTAIVPQDWVQIVRETRIGVQFDIQEMSRLDFFNIMSLERMIPRPRTLRVTEHLWYSMSAEEPHLIYARNDHSVGAWLPPYIIRLPNQRGRIINRPVWTHASLNNFVMAQKYNARIPITWEKFADLLTMLPMMMPVYRPFYENLPHYPQPPR